MSVKVVLLCGGRGTRLYEETEYRPKPLVEIGGIPIVLHIMKSFAYFGLRNFVLCLGYKGNQIKEYFLNYDAFQGDFTISLGQSRGIEFHRQHQDDFNITLADTGLDTMTGARVKMAERYVDTDIFIVTYGDGLCDVPIDDLIAFHRSHRGLATVTAIQPFSRFGELEIDTSGRVLDFLEKPQLAEYVSGGYFVFDRGVFDLLTAEPSLVLEGATMRELVMRGELYSYQHDGFFFAIDTYRDYLQAQEMWDSGTRPWAHWLRADAISGSTSHG